MEQLVEPLSLVIFPPRLDDVHRKPSLYQFGHSVTAIIDDTFIYEQLFVRSDIDEHVASGQAGTSDGQHAVEVQLGREKLLPTWEISYLQNFNNNKNL